jgi:signal transduction histidine kinase
MESASSQRAPDSTRDHPTPRARLIALAAVSRALASGARTLLDGAYTVLAMLGESEGWSAGAVWVAPDQPADRPRAVRDDRRDEAPRCAAVWCAPPLAVADLERASHALPALRGPAARAFASGRVVFVSDASRDDELRRDPRVEREGFRAAAAVPVSAGGSVALVIELFARAPRDADALAEDLWSAAAAQLAQLARRASAERLLARGDERLRTVVAHAPIILFAFDREGRLTLGEGRGLSLVPDHDMLRGSSIFESWAHLPGVIANVRRALAGEAFTVEVEIPTPDRPRFYETRYRPVLDAGGAVVEVIGVATDITERKEAAAALSRSEAQLIEADRLAALGTLAAGVAHEINNPLSYVLLNLDLLIRDLDTRRPAELSARLAEARSGVERVRLIVQDLKSFSRADTERKVPVDVRRVLDSTLEIAGNEIRHRARLVRAFGEIPAVYADPSRLGQVFLNLLVNAAQAMVEGEVSRNEIRVSTGTDASGRVIVEIRDTGAGIAREHLGRIFEPFFTTKPPGVGTGLGLSICRNIITALGGEIAVESEVGRGTTFRVALPAAIPEARSPAESAPLAPPAAAPARRRGRVLVIDDEPALAAALARSIAADYEVVVQDSGRSALDLLRCDGAFDAILCDLCLPGVSGIDVYQELCASAPALAERVIFVTGGTFSAHERDFLARVPNPALDKPFDLSTLSALLRRACMA